MTESPKDDEHFLSQHDLMPDLPTTNEPSLARYYIPDKIAYYPTKWGSEARKSSRKATGGWGAAAGPSKVIPKPSSSSSSFSSSAPKYKGNGVLFKPELYQDSTGSIGFSSSIGSHNPYNDPFVSTNEIGPPSSGHRNRKWGAGREAWGTDGGGDPALGAGNFEDDDGLDLSHDRSLPRSSMLGVNEEHATSNPSNSTSALLQKKISFLPRLLGARMPRTKRGKWNRFKWWMVGMNTLLTIYSIIGFVVVLLVWAEMFRETKVLDLVNKTEMVLAMTAMCLCFITCMVGWAGLILNNRSFLATYTFLLWVCFIFIVAPGYIAYKRRTFNLSGKMNQVWSRALSVDQRRTIQVTLRCCGYYSPFIEAAADGSRCFARSLLPGCKGPLIDFEKMALQYIYIVSFAIVPVHLGIIVTALLCADHITYRFGKGVTPKEYRVGDQIVRQAINLQQSLSHSPSHDDGIQKGGIDSDPLLSRPRPPFWHKSGSSSGHRTPESLRSQSPRSQSPGGQTY